MSMPVKTLARLVLPLVLAQGGSHVYAQPPSAVELGARASNTGRPVDANANRNVLRCFQAGRLIHESAGQSPAANDPGVHTFSAGEGQSSQVQVLDLHQAVCLLISAGSTRP